jgi:predicted phage-related endonuclease
MIDPQIRRLGIGGSDVGAIFGVDQYRDAFSLWAEKRGDLPKSAPNDRQIIGSALEPGVLKLYTHVTGREVRYVNETSRHPARPWMVYTPDALCIDERRGVDAKVVAFDQRRKWGATSDDIPMGIQLQCWYYMAALDYDVWDVAALVGDGMPRVYPIIRDLEAERVMLARVEEFYQRFIAGDEMPPIGGSETAAIWLQQAFPMHKRPDLRDATEDEIVLMTEYAGVRVMESELKRTRKELENNIKLAIADREGLIWEHGKFTWRKTKDTPKTNWESIARGLMFEYVKDESLRTTLLEMHTRVKPGPRRILFQSDLLAVPEEDDSDE